MMYSSKRRALVTVVTYVTILSTATLARANSALQEFGDYLNLLTILNANYSADGAYCHGSAGAELGLATTATIRREENRYLDRNLNPTYRESQTPYTLLSPKISLVKGLAIPIDLGLAYGEILDTDVSQWSGYILWTFFQEFKTPALAIKIAHSKLFGLHESEFQSTSLSLHLAYSFARYLSIFLSYGMSHHEANVAAGDWLDGYLLEARDYTAIKYHQKFFQGGGLKIDLVPGLFSISGEIQKIDQGSQSFSAKMAFSL